MNTPSLKLQMNLKGAWRDVISFDPAMEASVKSGAEQLFGHDQHVTLRIISPADSGPPLACWSAVTGWRSWGERHVARDPARIPAGPEPLLSACKDLIAHLDKNPGMGDSIWAIRQIRAVAGMLNGDSLPARTLTCVYCGHEYPQDTPAAGSQVLTDHINLCEKHPVHQARKDVLKLRVALSSLVGASTVQELQHLEAAIRVTPGVAADKVLCVNAIHALLSTMPAEANHGN